MHSGRVTFLIYREKHVVHVLVMRNCLIRRSILIFTIKSVVSKGNFCIMSFFSLLYPILFASCQVELKNY